MVLGGNSAFPANPDHHVRFKINGTLIGEGTFDGFSGYTFEGPVPAGVLAASNTLTLEVPADLGLDFDYFFVDSFSLTYPRSLVASGPQFRFRAAGDVLQVSGAGAGARLYRLDAGGPVRLTGVDAAGGTLTFRGTAAMADYVLVADGALLRARRLRRRGRSPT